MKDDLAESFVQFLKENGIDPIYAITILSLLITLSYWRDFKNWNNTPNWAKRIPATTALGTAVFVIMSLLHLLGIF
jgi:hypothetical protein